MIILFDAGKAVDSFQHPFMIKKKNKTPNKLQMRISTTPIPQNKETMPTANSILPAILS